MRLLISVMLNTEARLRAMDWILIRDVFEKLCFQMSTQAKTAFSKFPLGKRFKKKWLFGDFFLSDTCGQEARKEKYLLCFQTETEKCEQSLEKELSANFVILGDGIEGRSKPARDKYQRDRSFQQR